MAPLYRYANPIRMAHNHRPMAKPSATGRYNIQGPPRYSVYALRYGMEGSYERRR